MTVETFSLAEVSDAALPKHWKHPERWLRERLNRGEIAGYRVGRDWRLTREQLDALIAKYTNVAAPVVAAPELVVDPSTLGLSSRSRRRLLSA
ncbi:helix-turn-helix domain-containing protein [Mycobacteroides abscessus]|uniref:helix-turn-helix domain-containing protein n=1 Tax=Mycobacteroides abscessus TaxID=36809 RepID=UPI000C263552|nr:helix-turn-helix domain-containing protein [Mycobacteroides abscessus]